MVIPQSFSGSPNRSQHERLGPPVYRAAEILIACFQLRPARKLYLARTTGQDKWLPLRSERSRSSHPPAYSESKIVHVCLTARLPRISICGCPPDIFSPYSETRRCDSCLLLLR